MSKAHYSQAETVAIGRRILQFLANDLADFMAFDPSFNANFLSDFQNSITAAESHPDDETIVDIQTGYTKALNTKERECRRAYQRLKFFVENAFPQNKATQNEFGFNDYDTATTMAEFVKFMRKVSDTANKYVIQLTNVNYPTSDIAGLNTLHDELVAAVLQQEAYKSERMRLTDKRDELVTGLYENFITRTCKIGRFIYENNRAMYARYLLPNRQTGSKNTHTVGKEAREVVFSDVGMGEYFSLQVLPSEPDLQFFIAPNGSTAVPPTAVVIAANPSPATFSAIDLGFDLQLTSPQTLFVYNPNAQSAHYLADKMI